MKRPLIALVLALALPAAAQAGDYTNVEVGYATTETRLTDYYGSVIDAYDGVSLRGSWGFTDNWYATAEYREGDANFGLELDHQWSLGVGYHAAINDKADWFVLGMYGQEEENFGLDSKNTSIEAGVRGGSGKWYGLASAGYEDLNSNAGVLDTEQGFLRVGGGYRFNDTWSIGLEYKHGFEGASAGFIGPRISF